MELTASSTALSNPSAFVLPPSVEGITGAEVHPPTIPPPVPFFPNPMHFHHPFPEGNTGPKQHQPVIPPPAPPFSEPCILPIPSPILSISRYVLQRFLHYLWCASSSWLPSWRWLIWAHSLSWHILCRPTDAPWFHSPHHLQLFYGILSIGSFIGQG